MLGRIISTCRYLLIIPVIGTLLLTIGMVVMGLGVIITRAFELFYDGEFSLEAGKKMSIAVIEVIDLFLVGTVSYITSAGLYLLFLKKENDQFPFSLQIQDLSDLESKIIGMAIVVLTIAYLGDASHSSDSMEVLYNGLGTATVIAALVLFLRMIRQTKH